MLLEKERMGYRGEFSLDSSISYETPEVMVMAQQVKSGKATPHYEFAQGMVDYGEKNDPPPRIKLIYSDGKVIKYDGNEVDSNNLLAIEFINSGPGLAPEEATVIRHGGGNETLGQHGRGTSIALAYLAAEGMPVEIESNYDGHAWKGATSLVGTQSGVTKTLRVQGEWLDNKSNETVFRVIKPKEIFVDLLNDFKNNFLPANPKYPGAVIVEKSEEAIDYKLAVEIDEGRVACLDGIIDWDKIIDKKSVFVDGLLVSSSQHKNFMFPWEVKGLSRNNFPYQVKRSHDSSRAEGNPENMIQLALRNCQNSEIFEKLIMAATKSEDSLTAEIIRDEMTWFPDNVKTFNPDSKKLLFSSFKQIYPDCLIAESESEKQKIIKDNSDIKVVVVFGVLFNWLKEAGVETVSDKLGVLSKESFSSPDMVTIEYIDSPNCLEEFFKEIGMNMGTVRVINENGKKAIEILFPYVVSKKEDIYDRKKRGGILVLVSAIVAKSRKLGIDIVGRIGDEEFQLEFTVRRHSNKKFNCNIEVSKKKGSSSIEKENPNGLTIITLQGDEIDEFDPPAEELVKLSEEEYRRALEEQSRIMATMPNRKNKLKQEEENKNRRQTKGVSRRAFLKAGGVAVLSLAGLSMLAKEFSKNEGLKNLFKQTSQSISPDKEIIESIGIAESNLGVHELDYGYSSSNVRELSNSRESINDRLSNGFYREFSGIDMIINKGTGRSMWVNQESYERVKYSSEAPSNYSTRMSFMLNGEKRIQVKGDEEIIAIVSDKPIELFMEARCGNYVARGFSENVTIFTKMNEKRDFHSAKPVNEELVSILDFKSLDPKWQKFIAWISNSDFNLEEKASIILSKWGSEFVYSDRKGLDRQVFGDNIQKIGSNIVNTQKGICNISATGFVALLRESGVPARVVVGNSVSISLQSVGHMWVEFWNGKKWTEVDSLGVSHETDLTNRPRRGTRPVDQVYSENSSQGIIVTQKDVPALSKAEEMLNKYKTKIRDFEGSLGKKNGSIQAPAVSRERDLNIAKELGRGAVWTALGYGLKKFFDRKDKIKKEKEDKNE